MSGYGLIGRKLTHSDSPAIQKLLGVPDYALYELEPEALPAFVRSNALDGFNVTIPYKETIIPLIDSVSGRAARIGGVNTVIRMKDGSLYGDNTDAYGFARLLGDAGRFKRKKALVLGSGGASRAASYVLKNAGASVVVVSRSGENNYSNISVHADAALLVNATPVGMYPDMDASPLDISGFGALELVIDMIYNPARTRLLLQAQDMGVKCVNGLYMLAAQAQRACELWGVRAPGDDIALDVANIMRARNQNIALLGMPGCGKTTVGARVAKLTGRELIDTDGIAARLAGMPVAEIIKTRGEAAFRELETRALALAGAMRGVIISTGGGVVKTQRNRALLMQNSVCVWIQRALPLLAREGRPLSETHGVQALYEERAPLYSAWCERRYVNDDADSVALCIVEECL